MVCFLRMIQAWPHFHSEPTPTRTTEPQASDPRRSDATCKSCLPHWAVAVMGVLREMIVEHSKALPVFSSLPAPVGATPRARMLSRRGTVLADTPPEDTGGHPGVFPGFTDKELNAALQHSDAHICPDVLLSISKRFHNNPRPGFSTLGSWTPTAP